jgi:hypothetical protein
VIKQKFQLTDLFPAAGLLSVRCPDRVKDHIVPLVCGNRLPADQSRPAPSADRALLMFRFRR